ncbi:hypothetical protein ABBQ32_002858 [Trebouxia sp. C0010 RCD-2024]
MGSRELLLTLVTSAEALRRFLHGPDVEEHLGVTNPEDLRRLLPDRYGRDSLPRVPDRLAFDQRSDLLVCQLIVSLDRLPGGFIGIPVGTKALMGALCAPFCNLNGFSVPRFASQSFMVWEHRQLYRLITGALLHHNLAHLTSNLSVLAHSGSRLEAQVGSPAFAALVGSLTLSSRTLEVLYSRIAYKRLDDWHGYFLTTNVGASGLAFAIQVCCALAHACSISFTQSTLITHQGMLESYTGTYTFVPPVMVSWQSQRVNCTTAIMMPF